MKKRLQIFILVLCLVSMFSSNGFANIAVAPDFDGMLVITPPSGEVLIIEPGEPIPAIAAGASIEVFGKNFKIETDQNDKVQISCLNHTVTASGGSAVAVSCGESSGVIEVLKAMAHLVDNAGKESDLPEGTRYVISNQAEKQAPASGDISPTTVPGGGGGDILDVAPIDSRSIQASPST